MLKMNSEANNKDVDHKFESTVVVPSQHDHEASSFPKAKNKIFGFQLFAPKVEIGELVIRFLPSVTEQFQKFNENTPLILDVLSNVTIQQVKLKIYAVTSIPIKQMLLTFCGALLLDDAPVPKEAMDYAELIEGLCDEVMLEDNELFRPRVHLSLTPAEPVEPAQTDADTNGRAVKHVTEHHPSEEAEDQHRRRKKTHDGSSAGSTRSSAAPLREFDLRSELAMISCSQHFPAMERAGFDSEGSFAHLTESDLLAPGLWLPRRASVRILTLADTIKRRLEETDREAALNHNSHVEKDLLEVGKLVTVAIEGAGGAAGKQFTKKADIRRAWAEEEHHRKLLARNGNPQVSGDGSGKKSHSVGLATKIAALRERCAASNLELDDEEDSYSVRALSRRPKSPLKTVKPVVSFSSGQPARCCDKHHSAVAVQREEYLARRKMQLVVELQLLLSRVPSFPSGFVPSSTLLDIAAAKAAQLHRAVDREVLRKLINEHCMMDLQDQQRTVRWIAEEEVEREALVRVLPVKRFSAAQFITAFSDFMEKLDREHMR